MSKGERGLRGALLPLLALLIAAVVGYLIASGGNIQFPVQWPPVDQGSSSFSAASSSDSAPSDSDDAEEESDEASAEGESKTPQEVRTSYVVRYLSEEGEEIAPSKTVDGVLANTRVEEEAKSIDGYELTSSSPQVVMPNKDGSTVVSFIYREIVSGPEIGQGLGYQGDYILQNSDVRACKTSGLENLSVHELFLARDELFARHGAAFEGEKGKEAQSYFSAKSWYRPTVSDYTVSLLNPIEVGNAYAIQRVERAKNSTYVGILSDERRSMYQGYYDVVKQYQGQYGEGSIHESDGKYQMEGLCLVQLVDFQKNDWEELLLVYRDSSGSYRCDIWSDEGYSIHKDHSGLSVSNAQDDSVINLVDEGSYWSLRQEGGAFTASSFNYYLTSSTGMSSDRYALYPLDLETLTEETIRTLRTA